MSATYAIETRDLTKRFRKLQNYRDLLLYPWRRASHLAVDQVSLQIAQGELFGILGQNGAGKTTLIKMLSTALLPSSGQALIAGFDVVRSVRQVRSLIGVVSGEERSFYWRLTGRENLEFFAALHGISRAEANRRIAHLLDGVGMTAAADRPFRSYSTGMRQKLAIARGLLNKPRVLFMDEPTRSLDPISAQQVRQFVSEFIVGELNSTVILATHSMVEAEELCNRVAFVRAGRVVAQGPIAELRQTLRQHVHRQFKLQRMPPDLPDLLRRFPGVSDVEVSQKDGIFQLDMAMSDEGALFAAVLREIVESSADIHDCVTQQPTLKDLYLHTLGEPPAVAPPPMEASLW